MRWIFYTLILTIFISGYAAAAHALEPASSGHEQIQLHDNGDDNCGDQCCDSCHHACGAHAMTPLSVSTPLIVSTATPRVFYEQRLTGGPIDTLLRPPRA